MALISHTSEPELVPADLAPLIRQGYSARLLHIAAQLAKERNSSARDELFALAEFDRSAYWRGLAASRMSLGSALSIEPTG